MLHASAEGCSATNRRLVLRVSRGAVHNRPAPNSSRTVWLRGPAGQTGPGPKEADRRVCIPQTDVPKPV